MKQTYYFKFTGVEESIEELKEKILDRLILNTFVSKIKYARDYEQPIIDATMLYLKVTIVCKGKLSKYITKEEFENTLDNIIQTEISRYLYSKNIIDLIYYYVDEDLIDERFELDYKLLDKFSNVSYKDMIPYKRLSFK